MKKFKFCAVAVAAVFWMSVVFGSEPLQISGIYPHLAMFNEEDECGTGAVVPWADRLWAVTYAPHKPLGSTDKLYEITPALEQIIRPESIGGTPANRMIHRESQQLFIGPYAINTNHDVRTIPYSKMFGRPTGVARDLIDPTNKVVFATMEEGFYEVDVNTLAVKELWADEQRKDGRYANLPGYHGKGFYSAQGRYVYANNGDHSAAARTNPAVDSGVLAEWDGKSSEWKAVRRNQFTDVTGPGGIEGNLPGDDRLWTIGWDNRSLILMLLNHGEWHSYRLPKASHCYDGATGWNTEWPRIRDVGEANLLMTMHGSFWKFPKTFSAQNSAGIAPYSSYLKVIGDFCRWQDRIVFGCDDTAKNEFLNVNAIKGKIAAPGKSQSNLWFVKPEKLDEFGPALGRGAVWLDDNVKAGVPSEPFLFSGFAKRSLHLAHESDSPATFKLEVDSRGNGSWKTLREITVGAQSNVWTEFPKNELGAWIRLTANRDATGVTAFFQYRADDLRDSESARIFNGIAKRDVRKISGGLLHVRDGNFKTLRFLSRNATGELGCYDLDGEMHLRKTNDFSGAAWMEKAVAIPPAALKAEAGSILYVDVQGKRWRLPESDSALEQVGPLGAERLCREVCTERNLLNVGGSFYELPAENAGGFIKIRPIATHNRRISDFASYRGLLVISGISDDAKNKHILRSDDGKCALWVGVLDDLWSFGKPRGKLFAWQNSKVKAGVASDACLASGYDRKRLILSHTNEKPVEFRVEADFPGNGKWSSVATLKVLPNQKFDYQFPDAFGAYWLRVVADKSTTATATFVYE